MAWHTPLGYKIINGQVVIWEEHKKIVERIYRDYDEGISAWKIAEILKEEGIKNAKGNISWTHVSVGNILENQSYLGTDYYPQIIESELFDRVQRKREQKRQSSNRGIYRPNQKERLLFSGVLICAGCGECYSHVGQPYKNRPNIVPKWKCKNGVYQNKASCKGRGITDKQVENVCVLAVNSLIRDPNQIEKTKKPEQKVSPEYRRLEKCIAESDDKECNELVKLFYQRAEERYQTLEIRDEDIQTEEMKRILWGMDEKKEFDEELYRALIKQIVVYTDGTVKVIFKNNSSIEIGYGQL